MKYISVLFLLIIFSCSSYKDKALKSFNSNDLAMDIKVLSDDSLQGRAPFTIGEKRTVAYMENRMKEIGLEPAFGDSYSQDVPMVSVISKIPDILNIKTKHGQVSLKADVDYCAWSPTINNPIIIDKVDIVFMGFGIDAPDYSWNDFESIDIKNKIIVVLVNDPGFYTNDTTLFKGKAMTYYGRWRYKFEEAERKGALGCLIVHEDIAAGYPWDVAGSKNNTPLLYLDSPELKLFNLCGLDYELLKIKASQRNFKPFGMNAMLNIRIENKFKKSVSKNIAGIIKGSERPDEVVVYSAHWDHLGIGKVINGDSIYNGASDNAAAIAWMFSIAKAFKSASELPKRSVLFLSPTAEESGLYGSFYFVAHAPIDIKKTIACINNDVILFLGTFKDVTVTGIGHSSLDQLLEEETTKVGRYVTSDPNPENGMFFRSDQLPFLKAGVPAMFAKGYSHQTELGKKKTQELINSYWKNIYHKPSDEFDPKRDNLNGLLEDSKLFYRFGSRLVNEDIYPKWNRNSEFYVER